MNIKLKLTTLLLLAVGAVTGLNAQTAVTAGSQVTEESSIVSGQAYLIYYVGNGNSGYMKDTGSAYTGKDDPTPTENAVYYLTGNSTDGWQVQNYYTGNYWGVPTANANTYIGSDTAGDWVLNFQTSGNVAPSCNGHSWNRSDNNIHPWSSGTANVNQLQIYEVSLSTATPFSDFTDKDLTVSSTEAATVSAGTWYVMSQRSRTSYVYEDASSHTLKHTLTQPSGSATTLANYLVRLVSGTDGKYFLQTGLGNYVGQITESTNVPTTALKEQQHTVSKINSTNGHYYVQCATGNVILDANDFTLGDPATVVGWGTEVPTSTDGNNDWAFYPIELVESWIPTINEVYTINNTNTSRGAMMYNGTSNYVWSSGKSGTFDASDTNCQWVLVPTDTYKQYYLYNVGAGKFAIPSGTASEASWVFSTDAVAVKFITQSDGTKKIKTATTDTYAAVSNSFAGPIINYNDVGGNFTITKVDGADANAAATAAVAKLIKNQTPLTAVPTDEGWYAIRIKSGDYASEFVYAPESEIAYQSGRDYPLTFMNVVDLQPAIGNTSYLTRIAKTTNGYAWQLPNGKYLQKSTSNYFPTSTSEVVEDVSITYSASGMQFTHGGYKAAPYLLGNMYFIGETSNTGGYFDIYPINLATAGLTAWQVLCDAAPESSVINCTRSDVSGLTSVYKNGYIFLPTDVTPASSDFNLDGATSVTVDATTHTVTFAYDPNLAIVEDGVTVEQGWQTAGRGGEVMLLRITAKPFKDATSTTMTVSLADGTAANISALTLYEANNNSPEIYSTGDGAPTKTFVATATISGSTATFDIGDLTAGTHYYWIGATVSSTATLGAVLDAAVTGIAYTRNDVQTTLDLTSIGNPSDRGAMVFNVQSYPFLPRDNGSRVYRIPAMTVADDGSIVVACDKRYDSHTDIGGGHVIDIVVRRSTDGGKTWGSPVVVAKGDNSNEATCGYGDPSLYKDNDGKLYLLFAAGNTGYFYGLKRVCLSTSSDNGVTWTTPVDLYETKKMTDHATSYGSNRCYGLYDYFVTSGRGICTSEGYLMALLPAQVYTNEGQTEHSDNSQDYIFYSTDKGEKWHISENAIYTGGDEAKVIQTGEGALLASIRQGGDRGFNTATYTANGDGTLTFTMGTQSQNKQLNAGGKANNQDILYYQRETETGKTDVIFHSMTTGQHANLKLYYSTDQGQNWTEFLNVQTKGTRYVTMDKSSAGSLYLLFEDQSLNATGDYADYNHYPLNFLEITREQLEALIPTLNNIAISSEDLKIADGTKTYGPASYGDANSGRVIDNVTFKNTWTSNATSGTAGLTLTAAHAAFAEETSYTDYHCLGIKPSAGNATDVITITAPAGYIIKGYSLNAGYWTSSENYTLTASEGTGTLTCTTSAAPANSTAILDVTDIYKKSTTFTVKSNQADNKRCLMIKTFIVELTQEYPVKLNTVGSASYATLYLPFDVKTNANTKAYVIQTVGKDYASLTELENSEIAANTAVVLINETSDAAAFTVASEVLTQQVSEDDNLLKGTLVSMSLDLSDASSFYSLGKFNEEIGFYKFEGGTITLGANKAYLEVPVSGGSVKGFTFDFDEDATAIEMVNGQWSMVNDQPIYNLAGQRLNKPVKGINIVGGRKVLK